MHVHRGDTVELDPTPGSERRGTRPCLVVQNDIGNENAPKTIVVPFTTFDGDERMDEVADALEYSLGLTRPTT